jgi:hypothetical protein
VCLNKNTPAEGIEGGIEGGVDPLPGDTLPLL